MKTIFTIVADPSAVAVALTVRQGTCKPYERSFGNIAEAAEWLLVTAHGIVGDDSADEDRAAHRQGLWMPGKGEGD